MSNTTVGHLISIALLILSATSALAEQLAIKAGKILTVSSNPLEGGTILVAEGKIQAIGPDVVPPGSARIIDAEDSYVTPGLMDAQSSLFVMAGELRVRSDGAPELNITDALDPFAEGVEEVLAQGITAVYAAPVCRGCFGGRGAVLKVNGSNAPQGLVLKADAAVKATIGGSSGQQSASLDRLNDYANLREMLIETQAYMQRQRQYQQKLAAYNKQKAERQDKDKTEENGGKPSDADKREDLKRPAKPQPDPRHEILAKVLEKEISLQIEAHRVDDILNALRLAEEFDLSLILDKCTEGYRIAREIARRKVPVVVGPVSTSFAEMPQLVYRNHSQQNAGILATNGIQTAIGVAGRDGLSSKFVTLAGALAVANGMDKDAALRAITLTPAEIFGVADRIGSLDVGKDADIVIMTGHPFDAATKIERVLIEGKTVYERESTP